MRIGAVVGAALGALLALPAIFAVRRPASGAFIWIPLFAIFGGIALAFLFAAIHRLQHWAQSRRFNCQRRGTVGDKQGIIKEE